MVMQGSVQVVGKVVTIPIQNFVIMLYKGEFQTSLKGMLSCLIGGMTKQSVHSKSLFVLLVSLFQKGTVKYIFPIYIL